MRDDRGVVLVVVAVTIAAILVVMALALDLAGARRDGQRDGIAADSMVLAGTQMLDPTGVDNSAACTAAWSYVAANLPNAASGSGPLCATFAVACNAAVAREVSVTVAPYTFTFVNPVPDGHRLLAGQAVSASVDGTGCLRFGVEIRQTRANILAKGDSTVWARAVGTLGTTSVSRPEALVLLERTGCKVLRITGGFIAVTSPDATPPWIAIDSDGSTCSGSDKVLDQSNSGRVNVLSGAGGDGGIGMYVLAGPRASYAFKESVIVAVPNIAGVYPRPTPVAAPVTRAPVDQRYGAAISSLVASRATGVPAGFTRWTSVYSCSPGASLTVPAGNWYVDCPGGLKGKDVLTFRGGDIVADGTINSSKTLRFNCDAPLPATPCPADPAQPSVVFVRGTGTVDANTEVMHETFVYLTNNQIQRSGSDVTDWTSPDAPGTPFDDLLLWSESSTAIAFSGGSGLVLEGVYFAPNAKMTVSGETGGVALSSQIFLKSIEVSGTGNITLTPKSNRAVSIAGTGARLIR